MKDESPDTQQPDPAEPAGEQDPANEQEYDEATDRPEELGGEDAAEPEAAPGPAAPEDPLARLERERDEYLDLARRTQAEFENYRKRVLRDQAAGAQKAKAGLVRELLSVVDNLERALSSAGEEEQHLAEGVRLVHMELLGVLERSGIEGFDPRGEPFDPERHEALSMRPQEGADAGVVLDVIEKGYVMNGTVLRPARVVVSA